VVPFDIQLIRIFLHVLAATIWVGGQFTLAGLVPTLKRFGPEVTTAAARAFNRLAWPAYAVLILTGVWNLLEVQVGDRPTSYHMVLGIKLLLVAGSGLGAAAHVASRSKVVLAVGGSLAALGALGSLLLGVWLRG
jgi:putative copper export protein